MNRYIQLFQERLLDNITHRTFYHNSPVDKIKMLKPNIKDGTNFGIAMTEIYTKEPNSFWGKHQYEIKLNSNTKIINGDKKFFDFKATDSDSKKIYKEMKKLGLEKSSEFLEEALIKAGYHGWYFIPRGQKLIEELRIFDNRHIQDFKQLR